MADFDEMVNACCSLLAHAESDMDKMTALVYATPCIQSDQNNFQSLALLIRSIGTPFLRKMLSGHLDVSLDDDDAVEIYRKTALNIITAFCANPEIAKQKGVLQMIPHVFELVRNTKEPDEILECAIQYFQSIIAHDEGRQALLSQNAIKDFAWMYSELKSDIALDFVDILLRDDAVDEDASCFNFLMTSLAEEFSKNQTQKKFTICHHLIQILSLRQNAGFAIDTQKWPKLVLKGLKDILTSRIDDKRRVPALKLASAMVESYGMKWAVDAPQQQPTTPQQRQFPLLLVHLSSIECRMQMEDQPISSILKNADLIIACLAILEKAVHDLLGENIEMREKDQIVQSYSDAAAAVISAITAISSFEEACEKNKIFIYALIEFLCSGFAHDVLTSDAEAYKCMPFIMKVSTRSFREYEEWYNKNEGVPPSKRDAPIDLFEFLIPAFQHFAATKDGQAIITDKMDIIMVHMDFDWKVVGLAAREFATGMSGSKLSDCARSSLSLLVKTTELMTDTILVEPEVVKTAPPFLELFDKLTTMLPVLENSSVFNSLLSTASILGLVLIKHEVTDFSEEDVRVLTVLNGSIRFLKTYRNKIPSTEASVFQVGDDTQLWVNIREMWLLGVHLLGSLRQAMPWIRSHVDNLCPELLRDIDLAEDTKKLSIS